MEFEVSYSLDNEQQFWDELDDIVSSHCQTHELIDNVLRSYLSFTTNFKGEYLTSEYDVARCSYKLLSSPMFAAHAEYIRRQIVYGLLQDDAPDVLHFVVSLLLFDGRDNEITFEIMNNEGAFPRLLELIHTRRGEEEAGLHRLLMELLYEMSRIQRVKLADLVHAEDDFIEYLFQIIEELSDDASDPYHYPVIRVLLVLNEQFMVAAHEPDTVHTLSVPLTNKVIKILSARGSSYKTFGENIILLLNRESETSLQLLTLKLLYLLFTTPLTHEYFYTNDLRVLVDILIRNLLDLPEDASALRHTYLRVLYPLLAHTQLRLPPHYKREEIKKLLGVLVRGQPSEGEEEGRSWHFDDVDDTTKRLVSRCKKVPWLEDLEVETPPESPIEISERAKSGPTSLVEPPPPPVPRKLVKRNSSKISTLSQVSTLIPATSHLGMGLDSARVSSLSVLEVAAQREKPGVMTPSRRDGSQDKQKEKPLPPQARRSAWRRAKPLDAVKAFAGPETKPIAKKPPEPETATPAPEHEHEDASRVLDVDTPSPIERAEGTDMALMPTIIASHWKPPPPKARRWRGKRAKEEDEGGGQQDHHQTHIPIPSTHHPKVSIEQDPEGAKDFATSARSEPKVDTSALPLTPPPLDESLDADTANIPDLNGVETVFDAATLDEAGGQRGSVDGISTSIFTTMLTPPALAPLASDGPIQRVKSPFDESDGE